MELKVGDWVRIKDQARLPIPAVTKKTPQRVRAICGDQLILERWIIRFRSWVALRDIPITEVDLIPPDKAPVNSCLIYGFNQRHSGEDAFRRGHCKICTLKPLCDYWKDNHKGENGDGD